MKRLIAILALLSLTAPALAQDAVEDPPIPQPRPEGLGETQGDTPTQEPETDITEGQDPEPAESETGELERIYQAACPALISGRIVGEMIPPLSEGTCGQQSPIAVDAIALNGRQIALPGRPVTSCAVATALADWAEDVDAYADAALGTRIESLATGPGYQCRLRNGADTGFVSEHGLGNAVDISAITMADGRSITILDDWETRAASEEGQFLSFAHSSACTGFTTVLGPEANADHEDHFHFDLGCHGQSCTARICD